MNENLRILKPFLRGLPIVILSLIIAVLSAKKYLSYVTPIYESTAKLKLADSEEGIESGNLFKDFDVFVNNNKIAAEIEVLKSSALLKKVLEKVNFHTEIYRVGEFRSVELYDDSPLFIVSKFTDKTAFDVRYKITIVSQSVYKVILPNKTVLTGRIGYPVKFEKGEILVAFNNKVLASKKNIKLIDNYEVEFLSFQKQLEKVNKNLDIVSVDKDVPIIRINFKSSVPAKASLVVNQLAETYIQDYIENKYKLANTTVNFLEERINEASDKLVKSEDIIEDYRNQEKIINIRQETETDLRKISQLKIQQTNIKMSLDAIRELNTYINSGKNDFLSLAPNFEAFTDLLSTEIIKNIKKLQAEKKDLLLVYTSNDEKVKVIDEKIKDLTSYLIESIKNTQENLEIKYKDLSRDIEEAQMTFIGVPEKERKMNEMARDFDLLQSSYNMLNQKKIEAEIARSVKVAFHKIITPGEIPVKPVSPIHSIIIIVAALLGLIGSISVIYIVHYAKSKVNDTITIEKNSTIPIALTTPHLKNQIAIDRHFLKEAIQLELKGIVTNKAKIVLSSYDTPACHEFHLKNLALAFHKQNRKVIVIDAVGKSDFSGLIQEGIVSSDISDKKYNSYSQETMLTHINALSQDFDICLINNQCIANETIGMLLISLADQNLFILDSRKTAEKKVVKLELLKNEFSIPSIWFILNKAGYNPSIIKQGYKVIKHWILKFKK